MYPAVVILCTAMVAIHGVSCHLFPQAILHPLTNVAHPNEYKRQANTQLQCVSDRLDDAFPGNTSQFVSACKLAAVMEVEADLSDPEQLQAVVTVTYNSFCIPECGNIILDAYNDCGVFDTLLPGSEDFFIGLCGTNQNGDLCYQIYSDTVELITSESFCYATYATSSECTCQSILLEGVSQQGCCINAFHKFRSDAEITDYNPRELYDDCNVALPMDCDNSQFGTEVVPTDRPTSSPTNTLTNRPTSSPTNNPTNRPTTNPTDNATSSPPNSAMNRPPNNPMDNTNSASHISFALTVTLILSVFAVLFRA